MAVVKGDLMAVRRDIVRVEQMVTSSVEEWDVEKAWMMVG